MKILLILYTNAHNALFKRLFKTNQVKISKQNVYSSHFVNKVWHNCLRTSEWLSWNGIPYYSCRRLISVIIAKCFGLSIRPWHFFTKIWYTLNEWFFRLYLAQQMNSFELGPRNRGSHKNKHKCLLKVSYQQEWWAHLVKSDESLGTILRKRYHTMSCWQSNSTTRSIQSAIKFGKIIRKYI